MSHEKIEKLEQKQAQLKARLQQLRAKENAKQRKIETRKKILAGAAVLDAASRDSATKDRLTKILDGFLTAERDRALFDLPSKKQLNSPIGESSTSNAQSNSMSNGNAPENKPNFAQSMRNKIF